MAQVCLDSEVTVDFLRGERGVIEKLRYYADNEEICITPFSLMQLSLGIKKTDTIDAFIENVVILPFDKKASGIAVKILKNLKRDHKDMESVFTASICLAYEAFLFTNDRKKYEGIKGLKLV